MGAGFGEGDTVPFVRQSAGADGSFVGDVVNRVDRQGHDHNGVAAINRLQCGGQSAGLGEGDTVPLVRQSAGADGSLVSDIVNRVDNEVHRNDGVATVRGLHRHGLRTGLVEDDLVPGVRQCAFANDFGVRDLVGRTNCYDHGDDRVAAVGGLQRDGLGAGLVEGNTVPSVRQSARTNGSLLADSVGGVHNQGHSNHGVTAVFSFQRDILGTGLVEGDTVPFVRQQASTDGF